MPSDFHYICRADNSWKAFLIIFRKGEKLFVPTPYREFVELFPESEYRFFGIFKEFGDAQLDFTKDEKGNIHKVLVHIGFGRIQCEKIE